MATKENKGKKLKEEKTEILEQVKVTEILVIVEV
jgi:hypothetical protein